MVRMYSPISLKVLDILHVLWRVGTKLLWGTDNETFSFSSKKGRKPVGNTSKAY